MAAIIHHCRFSHHDRLFHEEPIDSCPRVFLRGQTARSRPDLHLQSFMLRVSWNPGRHSQAMPPFWVSLQMWAQPWFLSMQVGPSLAPSNCTVKKKKTEERKPLIYHWNSTRLIISEMLQKTCKSMALLKVNRDLQSRFRLLLVNDRVGTLQQWFRRLSEHACVFGPQKKEAEQQKG